MTMTCNEVPASTAATSRCRACSASRCRPGTSFIRCSRLEILSHASVPLEPVGPPAEGWHLFHGVKTRHALTRVEMGESAGDSEVRL